MRKLSIIAAVIAALFGPLAGGLPAANAATGDAAVFVFTANASVTNGISAPGFGAGVTANFVFDTEDPVGGIGVGTNRQRFCGGIGDTTSPPQVLVGVRLNGATLVSSPNAGAQASACRLRSTGTVTTGPVTGTLGMSGAFCGSSSGTGTVEVADLGGVSTGARGATIRWEQSGGTVLAGTVFGGDGSVVGAFAVQTTGAQPGTCGVVGGATTSFAVTGIALGVSV